MSDAGDLATKALARASKLGVLAESYRQVFHGLR